MSTTEEHVTAEGHEVVHTHSVPHDHPSDGRYVKIAVILAVLTAMEVSTYFWSGIFGKPANTATLVVILFPMMIIKFFVVAAYFMHLKFDNKLFRRAFITGLVLAVFVYCAALSTFQFWNSSYPANH
jgi:cytochrome c oxidase subunit 4